MFGQSSKSVPKKRFLPQPVGENMRKQRPYTNVLTVAKYEFSQMLPKSDYLEEQRICR